MQYKKIQPAIIIVTIALSMVTALIVIFGNYLSVGGLIIASGIDLLKFSFSTELAEFTNEQFLLYFASICTLFITVDAVVITYTGIRLLIKDKNAKMEKLNKTYFIDVILFFIFGILYLIIFAAIKNKCGFVFKINTNAYFPFIFGIIIFGINIYYKLAGGKTPSSSAESNRLEDTNNEK